VSRHIYSDSLVILAVSLEVKQVETLMVINNSQTVVANSTLLCIRVKVLEPVKISLIRCLAIPKDCNNLALG
jgi:hypothetical protein